MGAVAKKRAARKFYSRVTPLTPEQLEASQLRRRMYAWQDNFSQFCSSPAATQYKAEDLAQAAATFADNVEKEHETRFPKGH